MAKPGASSEEVKHEDQENAKIGILGSAYRRFKSLFKMMWARALAPFSPKDKHGNSENDEEGENKVPSYSTGKITDGFADKHRHIAKGQMTITSMHKAATDASKETYDAMSEDLKSKIRQVPLTDIPAAKKETAVEPPKLHNNPNAFHQDGKIRNRMYTSRKEQNAVWNGYSSSIWNYLRF